MKLSQSIKKIINDVHMQGMNLNFLIDYEQCITMNTNYFLQLMSGANFAKYIPTKSQQGSIK